MVRAWAWAGLEAGSRSALPLSRPSHLFRRHIRKHFGHYDVGARADERRGEGLRILSLVDVIDLLVQLRNVLFVREARSCGIQSGGGGRGDLIMQPLIMQPPLGRWLVKGVSWGGVEEEGEEEEGEEEE